MDVIFNNRYSVYTNGEVWSNNNYKCKNQYSKGRLLKSKINNSGYKEVRLYNPNTKSYKVITIHRLVALHFVSGYAENLEVNHKDGNKLNNDYSNLEWVTPSYNKIHNINTTNKYGCMHKLNGIIGENIKETITFISTIEAERAGFNRSMIRKAINKQILYKGYKWKFV